MSLRVRLTLGVAGLLVVVVTVLAIVTGSALRAYLIGSLDGDLAGATSRAVHKLQAPGLPGAGPGGAVSIPGQPPGTVAVFIEDGALLVAALLDDQGETTALDAASRTAIGAAVDGRTIGETFSADIPGLGGYRFDSVALADGLVLVMGQPLAEVERVALQHSLLAAGIGLVVIVIAAVGTWLIGSRLQRTMERLGAALAAREASERRLRRFAADASHELRTPLASIRGYAELTRRSGARLRGDVAHSLGRIESESIRMTDLVEDLLLLARLDESTPLQTAPVELAGLVATAVGDIQVTAPEHGWTVEAPEPVTVAGDEPRLHQAVVNLLANAARHTPAGTSVTVRVRRDGERAILEVEDDGPGIPAELLPNVTERFVRGDASRSRSAGSPGSTGLGLAIVQAVVEAHGGTVAVESVPGRTLFRLEIPIS